MPATTLKEKVLIHGHEVTITNPYKLLWPELEIRKIDYLHKLAVLAPYLLRYCSNRYLTTIRYPNGILEKFFYQKNCPQHPPSFVQTALLEEIQYVNLNSIATLMWLGNLACIEFHPSLHRIHSTSPAEWIIDLDPTLEEEPRIMEAAQAIGDILQSLHIQSIAKTSGATGVQLFIPLAPEKHYSFEQLRKLGHFIATYAVEKHPSLFTIARYKKDRGTEIYIDYLQHWHGKTLSAPYTPRARQHATCSTPLLWSEVKQDVRPAQFHLLNIEQRLMKYGDLIEHVPPQHLDQILAQIPDL